jgi:hypothetical protein
VRPWRRVISAIFARSGGPPATALITSAVSRKYCGALWFRRGMEIGARTHWSALLARGTLLGFGCQRGPRRGERARRSLPLLAGSRAPFVDGRLRMSGVHRRRSRLAWPPRGTCCPSTERRTCRCGRTVVCLWPASASNLGRHCRSLRVQHKAIALPVGDKSRVRKGLLSRRLILSKVHLVL